VLEANGTHSCAYSQRILLNFTLPALLFTANLFLPTSASVPSTSKPPAHHTQHRMRKGTELAASDAHTFVFAELVCDINVCVCVRGLTHANDGLTCSASSSLFARHLLHGSSDPISEVSTSSTCVCPLKINILAHLVPHTVSADIVSSYELHESLRERVPSERWKRGGVDTYLCSWFCRSSCHSSSEVVLATRIRHVHPGKR
jgi:hypothetical protein